MCEIDYHAGKGTYGIMTSGCPETFESPQESQEYEGESGQQRFRDKHQKVEEFRQGDVLAIKAGEPHWVYNDGDEELVLVVLHHNSNNANQLDQNPRVRTYTAMNACHHLIYIYI